MICPVCKKENEAKLIYSVLKESKYKCKKCKTVYCKQKEKEK